MSSPYVATSPDSGLPEEREVLVKELADIKIPICAVLGNHDFEHDKVVNSSPLWATPGSTT